MKVTICKTTVTDGPGKSHDTFSVYPKSLRKNQRVPPYGLVYWLTSEDDARRWCASRGHTPANRVIWLGKI